MSTTPTYLVVWRQDGEFLQSQVNIGILDPRQMSNNDWVSAAAKSEGYTSQDVADMLASGYEMILVCDFPAAFYDQ
jgi:hypothetical protein